MGNYLSPGVYVKEVDASAIVPTVSNSMAFFAGHFQKGPLEEPFVITNKQELEDYYGQPTNENYNEWFQCYKYLDYSNQLTINRIFDTGFEQVTDTPITITSSQTDINGISYKNIQNVFKGSVLKIGDPTPVELIVNSISGPDINNEYSIQLKEPPLSDVTGVLTVITTFQNSGSDLAQNGLNEDPINQKYYLFKNQDDFEFQLDSGSIAIDANVKLKFFAKTSGKIENNIEIAICNPVDFIDREENGYKIYSAAEVFEGYPLINLFDYQPLENPNDPTKNEIGIIIKQDNTIETFIVSFDKDAIDGNNKSKYVEDVINNNSNIVNVMENPSISLTQFVQPSPDGNITYQTYIASHIYKDSQGIIYDDMTNITPVVGPRGFYGGMDYLTNDEAVNNAYSEVENKELYDIDVVIANPFDEGDAAILLANTRKDCIAMVGARFQDVVGKKSAEATKNIIDYMNSIEAPMRTMFAAYFGNQFKIYDNYNKKYRWINIAGDMAGLRCQTNTNQASWWASAGLQRGVIRNIDRIAFSPNEGQRDQLYKNSINPVVNFPGQGNLVWGQKTLLNYASAFDRINVRGLFNTIERSMAKAAKSSVFEFNDSYTRNSILAMFNPFLASVKAGRGIEDFVVICDETNNTPDVISRNELHVDIYIKPMYTAEFIQLTFTNIGTRSFASIIGA